MDCRDCRCKPLMRICSALCTYWNSFRCSTKGFVVLHNNMVTPQVETICEIHRWCRASRRRWWYRQRQEPLRYDKATHRQISWSKVRSWPKRSFTSLFSQQNAIDRALRADVNIILYEFETGYVNNVVGIPGSANRADPDIKKDMALAEPLLTMLQSGIIPFYFRKA